MSYSIQTPLFKVCPPCCEYLLDVPIDEMELLKVSEDKIPSTKNFKSCHYCNKKIPTREEANMIAIFKNIIKDYYSVLPLTDGKIMLNENGKNLLESVLKFFNTDSTDSSW